MRIEEGKYYRTRGGRKVGPMVRWSSEEDSDAPWSDTAGYDSRPVYRDDGTNPYGSPDLISEWTEHSPIRTETVTVRRLEPGVYGRLYVRGEGDYPFGQEKQVEVGFVGRGETVEGARTAGYVLRAPELRELARVALEIAEYLDAQ